MIGLIGGGGGFVDGTMSVTPGQTMYVTQDATPGQPMNVETDGYGYNNNFLGAQNGGDYDQYEDPYGSSAQGGTCNYGGSVTVITCGPADSGGNTGGNGSSGGTADTDWTTNLGQGGYPSGGPGKVVIYWP